MVLGEPPPAPRRRLARVATLCAWGYLACAVALVLAMYLAGDRWWPATVLLFGPRWIWFVPAVPVILASAAVRGSSRLHPFWAAVAAGALVFFLVMGFNVPVRHSFTSAPVNEKLRIVTANTGSRAECLERLHGVAGELEADILALEECPQQHFARLWPDGHVYADRGICLVSKYPFHDAAQLADAALGGSGVAARFEIEAPRGTVRLVIVHLETPRDGLDELRARASNAGQLIESQSAVRQREAETVRDWLGPSHPAIVAGDFNTPIESRIFSSVWDAQNLTDAFSTAGWGFGYSKRTRLIRVRIDHVLLTDDLAVESCQLGPDIGSDHLPVIADLRWKKGGVSAVVSP